ncbi:hypothetical protein DFH08DRAFT_885257 [Mycena albidolilacea]|uniref:Uncharacterized protein n=1 Tax=Mycena albidolilacea TaxID=1033008 RepID=A0AAD6ZKW8_9AGAR|nr:hypothetical protein DFH08DRAFT_885257 [Mycena albidolilacea]
MRSAYGAVHRLRGRARLRQPPDPNPQHRALRQYAHLRVPPLPLLRLPRPSMSISEVRGRRVDHHVVRVGSIQNRRRGGYRTLRLRPRADRTLRPARALERRAVRRVQDARESNQPPEPLPALSSRAPATRPLLPVPTLRIYRLGHPITRRRERVVVFPFLRVGEGGKRDVRGDAQGVGGEHIPRDNSPPRPRPQRVEPLLPLCLCMSLCRVRRRREVPVLGLDAHPVHAHNAGGGGAKVEGSVGRGSGRKGS